MPGAKEKVCRVCKRIVVGNECDNCGSTNLTIRSSGLIIVVDPEKSEIAKELGLKKAGAYATKI
ncbi:MAG: DNA-directed RNA polymerase subunit E'' [Aigarchaeota archaeon]|nr:DNA-directed RNA polymerase subunit E'' [Aigarchaeota archaeon]MCX8193510.1 DNA-directed RNA polymerase subunit E'' [Nitrososphaeria archaeon]MDW7986813.1 transcription elongation factor subunit Spt4 [Nitrososphaerota archaeon]